MPGQSEQAVRAIRVVVALVPVVVVLLGVVLRDVPLGTLESFVKGHMWGVVLDLRSWCSPRQATM